jgi:hypothetical protein
MCCSLPFEGLPFMCFTTSDGLANPRSSDLLSSEFWTQSILLTSELSETTRYFLFSFWC